MIALVLTRVSCGSATAAQGTDGSESWSLSRESTQCQLPRTPARTSLDKPTRRAHEFDFSELVTLERTLEDEVKSMTVPAVGAGSRLSKCPRVARESPGAERWRDLGPERARCVAVGARPSAPGACVYMSASGGGRGQVCALGVCGGLGLRALGDEAELWGGFVEEAEEGGVVFRGADGDADAAGEVLLVASIADDDAVSARAV